MRLSSIIVGLSLIVSSGCKQPVHPPKKLTREEQVVTNIDSLNRTAGTGDLLVRLGDDVLSYQIKNMNEKDKSYSHAGIILEEHGQKTVLHIAPDDAGKDVIEHTPLDSFIAPAKNLDCALYRYNFSPAEKDSFLSVIRQYEAMPLHFDRVYRLETDSVMYCSEMISKALKRATHNRIACRIIPVPTDMVRLLVFYFKGQAEREEIARRTIMTIDNLYLLPSCTQVMKFKLKYLPGE